MGRVTPLHSRDRLPEDLVTLVPLLLKSLNKSSYQRERDSAIQGEDGPKGHEDEEEGEPDPSRPPPLCFHQLRPTLDQSMDWQRDEVAADKAEALVQARSVRKGLIVVGSLLDNLPNVAGLCRTAESMNCEALVVSSRLLAASDEFKRQSVTSEHDGLGSLRSGPKTCPPSSGRRRKRGTRSLPSSKRATASRSRDTSSQDNVS